MTNSFLLWTVVVVSSCVGAVALVAFIITKFVDAFDIFGSDDRE